MMRTKVALIVAGLFVLPILGGCSDFDAEKLDFFNMNKEKKLPGERKPLFPEGVPGVTQGIPPDLVKGYKPPETAAAPEPEPEKPKPRVVRRAPKPTPVRVSPAPQPAAQPAPAAQAQRQQPAGGWPAPPQQQQTQQGAQSSWPAPPSQPQQPSAWPAPPAPNTFQR
jgi:hypothetical protein